MLRLRATVCLLSLAAAGAAWAADPGSDRGVVNHKDGFYDAATSPLEDLNLKHIDVPAVLERAQANPYDMDGMDHCEQIAAEVGRLDEALGPDLDEAPPPDTRTRAQKVGSAAHDAAVGGARAEIDHFIPFRGWIRQLTGAERHAKAVQKAVRAGSIRRGYLKGVGMRKNCAPPAAPSWFKPRLETEHAAARPSPSFADLWGAFWAKVVAWFRSWWPF